MQPCQHPEFSQGDLYQTSDVQSWKIRNLYCLKPANSCQFHTAARGNQHTPSSAAHLGHSIPACESWTGKYKIRRSAKLPAQPGSCTDQHQHTKSTPGQPHTDTKPREMDPSGSFYLSQGKHERVGKQVTVRSRLCRYQLSSQSRKWACHSNEGKELSSYKFLPPQLNSGEEWAQLLATDS